MVWNYSWPLFPYVWNEIKFQIAYQSDLQFVSETMQRIVEEDLGEEMVKRVEVYRELLARTPVDELEVRSRPVEARPKRPRHLRRPVSRASTRCLLPYRPALPASS